MSAFDPKHIVAIAKLLHSENKDEQEKFEKQWMENVERRWKGWQKHRDGAEQIAYVPQLEFIAHVVEYVNWVYLMTKTKHGRKLLRADIPLYGPTFVPPSYMHEQLRNGLKTTVTPETTYLKAVTIIHPLYFPSLAKCPGCSTTKESDLEWSGWVPTGHCEVHGVEREETALGYQLRCTSCKAKAKSQQAAKKNGEGSYCFSTTNHTFWMKYEHWQIPAGIPIFLKRRALTRELFDLITELRIGSTSAGLEEHFKQLHLLRYHLDKKAYLDRYQELLDHDHRSVCHSFKTPLQTFSIPTNAGGYGNPSISNDLISDVYLLFSENTRKEESNEHIRSLSAITLSIDQTYRAAGKAKVVDGSKKQEKRWLGGLLDAVNQDGETVAWRFCQTNSASEASEMCGGLKKRNKMLEQPDPEVVVSDNCCKVAKAVKTHFPKTHVGLDVWHVLRRYMGCVVGGRGGNGSRSEIAKDITSAILKTRADKYNPSIYWPSEEQETRLEEVYNKWAKEGAWTTAGASTHSEQMKHVRKGCLTRPRNDIRADGSRIEGNHRAWNGLQRSWPSGLEMLTALCHDLVLRRNMRIGRSRPTSSAFTTSTYGSHHIRLVRATAQRWNGMIHTTGYTHLFASLADLPLLKTVASGETFGVVQSQFVQGYQYLITDIKQDDDDDDLLELSKPLDERTYRVLSNVDVGPRPLQPPSATLLPLPSAASLPQPPIVSLAVSLPQPSIESLPQPPAMSLAVSLPQPPIISSAPLSDVPIMSARPKGSNSTGGPSSIPLIEKGPDSLLLSSEQPSHPSRGSSSSKPLFLPLKTSRITAIGPGMDVDSDARTSPPSGVQEGSSAGQTRRAQKRRAEEENQCGQERRQKRSKQASSGTQTPSSQSKRSSPLPQRSQTGTRASTSALRNTGIRDFFQPRDPTPATSAYARTDAAASSTPAPITSTPPAIIPPTLVSNTTFSAFHPPLKLPPVYITGKTRSQRIFSVKTGVDPQSTKIDADDEHSLFMRLRERHQWVSHNMNPRKYVEAASVYNTELEKQNRLNAYILYTVRKTPRAIMDKLASVEDQIIKRLVSNDFVSKSSETTAYWKRHCFAVRLLVDKTNEQIKRKPNTCNRCKSIMWPGGKGKSNNHRLTFCSDGVRMSPELAEKGPDGTTTTRFEVLPPWPQPSGIFAKGTTFMPHAFLRTAREFYLSMVTLNSGGGHNAMEYMAFAEMLHARTITVPADESAAVDSHPASSSIAAADSHPASSSTAINSHPASSSPTAGISLQALLDAYARSSTIGFGGPGSDNTRMLFRLFDTFELGPCRDGLIEVREGVRYLRITPFQDNIRPVEEEEEEEEEELEEEGRPGA